MQSLIRHLYKHLLKGLAIPLIFLYERLHPLLEAEGIVIETTFKQQWQETEAALRQSEEQNRAILSATPDIMAVLDSDGIYLSCSYNGFTGELIALENMDPIGRSVTDVLPPIFADQWLVAIGQVLSTGKMQVLEQQNRFGDRIQYEEVRMVPYKEDQILCLVRNISDRKQAEISLRQSEAKQAALIQVLPDLIMRVNREGIYLDFFGTSVFKVIGDRESMLGTHVLDSLPPELAQRRMDAIHQALETGKIQIYEQQLWVEGALQTEECRVTVCGKDEVLIIGRDISDRKQAEAALRQSEAKNRAMLAALPDLLLRVKRDGTCLDYIPPSKVSPEIAFSPIQLHLREVLPENLLQHELHRMEQALQTQELQVWEHQLIRSGRLCTEEVRLVHYEGDEFLVIVRDITERKQAEAALRKSEERRRQALELTETGSWEFDVATGEAIWSDSHYRLMGIMPGTLPSNYQTWRERVHPKDLERTEQAFNQALATHTLLNVEYRIVYPDGQVRWVLTRGQGIYDSNNHPVRMLGVMMDITDRKQAELALQQLNEELDLRVQQRSQELVQSERDLRTIFNNVYDAILIHDLDGNILDMNDRALELRGATREQLLAASILELSAPDAPIEQIPEYWRRAQTGERLRFEWREQRLDNHSIFDVEVSLQKVTLGNRPVVIAGVRDISARKRAEKALRESEHRYATLAATAPVAIFRLDNSLNCTYVSEHWSELTGRPIESALGKGWMEALHPDDRNALVGRAVKKRNQVKHGGQWVDSWEGRHLLPDGRVNWFYVQVATELDGDGRAIGRIGTLIDITQRKQIEAALVESEAKFRRLVEGGNDLIWAGNVEGKFTYLSPQFKTLFGWEPNDWLGQSFFELLHPDDRFIINPDLQKKAESAQTVSQTEFRHLHRDGHYIWVRASATPVKDADGNFIGFQGILSDINDRKQAEAALQAERFRLQLALDAAQMGSWSCSTQTGHLMWSDRTQEIFGFVPGTFSGDRETFLAMVHPEDRDRVLQEIAHTFNTGAPYNIEYRIRRADGEIRWLGVWGLIPPALSPSESQIVGVVCDITERKQAEINLKESQRFLQTVIDTLPMAVFWKNCQSVYLGCNQRNALIAGLASPSAIIGKTDYDLPCSPKEAEGYRADDRSVMDSGEAKLGIIETLVQADGSRIWIETNKLPLYNLNSEVIGVLGTWQDITERKQAEATLNQLNQELEQRVAERTLALQKAMEAAEAANRSKSIFLANMSHELRTPLNAILGFAQLMARDLTLSPERRSQIDIINRSGNHLLHLINDILEMSKIEAGRISFTPQILNLDALLNTIEDMFNLRAMEKRLTFRVDRASSLPPYIETDENKLRQVLINLVGNAIKFTSTGHVILRIQGQASEGSKTEGQASLREMILHFEVEDTGIGIDPTEMESLFEPFIQSRNRSISQEGTGLGLPISRQFVELMGGRLTVRSLPGIGSTFAFSIPVREAAVSNLPPAFVNSSILGLLPNQPPYRILVVEDNETNRQLLVQVLQSVGFEVEAATNGQEAIVLWECWQPHFIWMDMRMPIMDGYEATQRIREKEQKQTTSKTPKTHSSLPATPQSPTIIIALTANAFEEDRARVLEVGCNDFVRKPFEERDLLEKMASYLNVQYRYTAIDSSHQDPIPVNALDSIAVLRSLSPSWVASLHQATLQLDNQQIKKLIAQIAPDYPELSALLLEQVDNFNLDQILNLLQAAM